MDITETSSARTSEFKLRNRRFEQQTVTENRFKDLEPDGWVAVRPMKSGLRIRKDFNEAQLLENRFWCFIYRIGYPEMNRGRFFRVPIAGDVKKQIDVFAKDNETVVIAECKTSEDYRKKSLQKDLGEFAANKRAIADAIRKHYGLAFRPKFIWLFVIGNFALSQSDLSRAKEHQVGIISDRELTYFEELARALGAAARQQFKAEYLSGQQIPALENKKVPATKTKIGGNTAYCFSINSSDLLSVAFVNHRDLRDPTSAPTYQRLVNPGRIKKVANFLERGGYFPNSILLNFQNKPRFDLALKSDSKDISFGHLYLPAKYKSLKVIDGQHRLYGCAVLPEYQSPPNIFCIAFEQISGSEEASLFATINKEQQKVQKRLLDELDGELRWDSELLYERVQAVCSRAIDLMNSKFGNPFENKVISPGLHASDDSPLTLPEIRKALIGSGLVVRASGRDNMLPGPLSVFRENKLQNEETMSRLIDGLSWYFSVLRAADEDRWEQGKSGYICNNFGVPSLIRLFSEIVKHIEKRDNINLCEYSLREIFLDVEPFLEPIKKFIRDGSPVQVEEKFRVKLGSGGIKQYYFALSQIVNAEVSDFKPAGFEAWLSEVGRDEQERADRDAKWIQDHVHSFVVEKLREIYGAGFFDKAISNKEIQVSAHRKRLEDDEEARGGPEKYLDFLDLKKIVEQKENWPAFESFFNFRMDHQKKGGTKYIQWFDEVNRIRRISAHPYQRNYSGKDLSLLDGVMKHLNAVFQA